MTLTLLAFLGLATYRLTRLVVRDDFPPIRWARQRVIGPDTWDEDEETWVPGQRHVGTRYEWFGELISCHWCASGWVALGLTATGAEHVAGWRDLLLTWIAAWAVGAVLADKLG